MKYYPIGTVVTLKNGNRPIMIYGRKQLQLQTNKQWDYVACLYPEGNLGDDYNIFFQQEEINSFYDCARSRRSYYISLFTGGKKWQEQNQ